ncbi:GGDEF domain-containing protein [Photobacterium damselae]|uniref:GGDEF domain-containing protein n=1 Tax=Photobacterium damselae TaxID=38293 RepID=UPI00209140D7|nr:GGDEF domain-containing protein [Photobacterium damselae]USR75700.1 GGDEF domain-containing protein [Photobacterium damselae]
MEQGRNKMATLVKSTQLESVNFAYIELSKNTLQRQLSLLFTSSGIICTLVAFAYFVAKTSLVSLYSALLGLSISYTLAIFNRININPKVLMWIFILSTTLACITGYSFSETHHISNTIGLTIPLLCFFTLKQKTAAWYSGLFGFCYVILSISEIGEKQLQLNDALQNMSAYSLVFVMAYLLAKHRNEAIHCVKQTATNDFLTGLYNREGLLPIYQAEAARSERYLKDFSMLLLSVDDFKNINDRYGLETGDKVLMMLTKCLQQLSRKEDTIARLGGTEFCLLLPDTSLEQAEKFALRLQEQVNSWVLELESGHRISVTLSMGLTPIQFREFNYDYIKADNAVMRAKHWGGNQLAISE